MNTHITGHSAMPSSNTHDKDLHRMEAAADWLQRLHASPGDERLLGEWLEWCQMHSDNLLEFQRLQAVWEGVETVSVTVRPRPKAADSPARASPLSRLRSRWVVPASLAAAVLLALTVFNWKTLEQLLIGERELLVTPVAQRDEQSLPDGSHVELGAQTRLVTRFTSVQREVTIESGDAFFTVAKDPARPFVVRAGELHVTAIGTAFGVRRGAERTVITVSEGTVSVGSSGSEDQIQAQAWQEVTYLKADRRISVQRVDPTLATSWREGILKFVDEPLETVVADLNRYSGRKILLTDQALRRRLFTGTVYEHRLGDWLHALERVFPLHVVEEGGVIRLMPYAVEFSPAGSISVEADKSMESRLPSS